MLDGQSNKKIGFPIILSFMYIIFFSIIKIICYSQHEVIPFLDIVTQINNILTLISNYSIFLSAMVFISLFLIWKDNHE